MSSNSKFTEKQDENPKIKDFIATELKNLYYSHIPVDTVKDMPRTYQTTLGFVAYGVFVGLLVYFINSSYQNAIQQPYMSLQPGQGCDAVPILVTGDYTADIYGNWLGTADFSYVHSIYDIQLDFFNEGLATYQSGMKSFYTDTSAIGNASLKQDLAVNLIYWMSYYVSRDVGGQSSMKFQFTGNPATVFDADYVHASFANIKGTCMAPIDAMFTGGQSAFTITGNYKVFSNTSNCVASLNPFVFGYYPVLVGTDFLLNIDVNSFAAAIAVNFGILSLGLLVQVPDRLITVPFNGINVTFGEYFDIRTPSMTPILCILSVTANSGQASSFVEKLDSSNLCMLKVGSMLALPVFNHVGANTSQPDMCRCDSEVGYSAACQQFNLMPSLIFYNAPTATAVLTVEEGAQIAEYALIHLLALFNQTTSYAELNSDAYNATFSAAAAVYPGYSKIMKTQHWRSKAFQFCKVTVGLSVSYCSVLALQALSQTDQSVSLYKYQLVKGSCTDSFTIPTAAWNELIDTPPTSFNQIFYECYYDKLNALLNAVGIAQVIWNEASNAGVTVTLSQGNVQTALPMIVISTLPLIYFLLFIFDQLPPKEEYQEKQKLNAVLALGLQLLRFRDGKTRALKSNGVITQLGRELIKVAKEEGGYPDSDDSDSDDDDDDDAGTTSASGKPLSVVDEKPKPSNNDDSVNGRNSSIAPKRASRKKSLVASTVRSRSIYGRKRTQMDVFLSSADDTPEVGIAKKMSSKIFSMPSQTGISLSKLQFTKRSSATTVSSTNSALHNAIDASINGYNVLNGLSMNSDIAQSVHKLHLPIAGLAAHLGEIKSRLSTAIDLERAAHLNSSGADRGLKSRDTTPYREARVLAMQLRDVQTAKFETVADATVLLQLINVISMHASIALGCPLASVASTYGSIVSYNIGGTSYTIDALSKLVEQEQRCL